MKRREPIFWLENRCPFCNHVASYIYKPDLLKGPIEFECQRNNICYGRWSVVIDPKFKSELEELIVLAERRDKLYAEIDRIRPLLGYKD